MAAANDPLGTKSSGAVGDGWVERWLASCADLASLQQTNPMTDAVIDEIDGRRIRIGDRWLIDFASCNYLGFDLERSVMDSIPGYVERWGTHPSWSRLLGSPVLYEEIEQRLATLLGCEDTLVLPTITLIHLSVIPVLAAGGTIFVDRRAHKTIYEGCQFASIRGASVKRFEHEDADDLERLLREEPAAGTRLICIDGVNSMTGNAPEIGRFAKLAREHDAILYVDDAHGFGVVGERPDESSPYGSRGNGIVQYYGESYDNVILVAGLSKAYSSLAAFIACPTDVKRVLKTAAPPYLYSGPSPVASLATVIAGLDLNDLRGDEIRHGLWEKTDRVLRCLDKLGVHTPNHSGFPIIEIPLANHEDIDQVGRFLFAQGIYTTLAAYPLVPRHEVGFRIQTTAANTMEEIDELVDVLGKLADRFELQPSRKLKIVSNDEVAA